PPGRGGSGGPGGGMGGATPLRVLCRACVHLLRERSERFLDLLDVRLVEANHPNDSRWPRGVVGGSTGGRAAKRSASGGLSRLTERKEASRAHKEASGCSA